MKNRQTEAAWNYHNSTKHSYESVRTSRHYLDWENQPIPFKIYTDLDPIPLPANFTSSGVPALDAVAATVQGARAAHALGLKALAEILFFSAGVTKRKSYPGGEILFRAAACTGALYHIDLYVACGDLQDLQAGVYHFSPHDFSLRGLRSGDHRKNLEVASGMDPSIEAAPCILMFASTYWRNAWKYQSRAYRHCYWDSGTILANLLATAAARNIEAKAVLGFVDDTVHRLLGLDPRREGALLLVALGRGAQSASGPEPPLATLAHATVPLSKREVDYPLMRAMHDASALETKDEVLAWRQAAGSSAGVPPAPAARGELFFVQPAPADQIPRESIESVIVRRGSTREFVREPITLPQLATALDRSTRPIPADFLEPGRSLVDIYLIVHAVEGLPAGAYYYHREKRALELLKAGDFRREAGYLGLGQAIPADCSVNVYFFSDLERVLDRLGNRGYRAAQLEAATMGGKMYLAAYAQRLGASGLTFFDDDATAFFSPHAAGKSVMFLIALGKAAKRGGAAAG